VRSRRFQISTAIRTSPEIAIVLGSAVEYTISEVADRNAGVAAKLRKDRLVLK